MAVGLKAVLRDSTKKSLKKQLRNEGKIPAIVYGKTIGNQNVAVEEGELMKLFLHSGLNEVIQLEVEGGQTTPVMTKEMQRDPLKKQLIHVDFKEVNMKETVEVAVPLHIIGEEVVEKHDGVVQQNMNEVHVRALPGRIPNFIELDVTHLQIGDSIKVDKLKSGVNNEYEIVDEDEEVLVTINHPQLIPDEPVAEEVTEEVTQDEEQENRTDE